MCSLYQVISQKTFLNSWSSIWNLGTKIVRICPGTMSAEASILEKADAYECFLVLYPVAQPSILIQENNLYMPRLRMGCHQVWSKVQDTLDNTRILHAATLRWKAYFSERHLRKSTKLGTSWGQTISDHKSNNYKQIYHKSNNYKQIYHKSNNYRQSEYSVPSLNLLIQTNKKYHYKI